MSANSEKASSAVTDGPLEETLRAIDRDGYTIVENAIESEFIAELRENLERLERDLGIAPARNDFEGERTYRIYNLLAHGGVFEKVPVHPRVLPIVEGVLDSGCLISSLSSIDIAPGETPQLLHSDDQVIGLPRPHPAVVCNTLWALSDFSEENGGTHLVPGSHKWDHCPDPTASHEHTHPIQAVMPRGSILIWHGSLWHGGGANRSAHRRTGIAMNYCAGFIRQQENQQLGIPREVACRFSPRLKQLVGYGVYRALIGHIDKRDPAELLGDDGELRTIWDR